MSGIIAQSESCNNDILSHNIEYLSSPSSFSSISSSSSGLRYAFTSLQLKQHETNNEGQSYGGNIQLSNENDGSSFINGATPISRLSSSTRRPTPLLHTERRVNTTSSQQQQQQFFSHSQKQLSDQYQHEFNQHISSHSCHSEYINTSSTSQHLIPSPNQICFSPCQSLSPCPLSLSPTNFSCGTGATKNNNNSSTNNAAHSNICRMDILDSDKSSSSFSDVKDLNHVDNYCCFSPLLPLSSSHSPPPLSSLGSTDRQEMEIKIARRNSSASILTSNMTNNDTNSVSCCHIDHSNNHSHHLLHVINSGSCSVKEASDLVLVCDSPCFSSASNSTTLQQSSSPCLSSTICMDSMQCDWDGCFTLTPTSTKSSQSSFLSNPANSEVLTEPVEPYHNTSSLDLSISCPLNPEETLSPCYCDTDQICSEQICFDERRTYSNDQNKVSLDRFPVFPGEIINSNSTIAARAIDHTSLSSTDTIISPKDSLSISVSPYSDRVGFVSCHMCKVRKPAALCALCNGKPNSASVVLASTLSPILSHSLSPTPASKDIIIRTKDKDPKIKSRRCTKNYCSSCLTRHYSLSLEKLNPQTFTCPACYNRCICSSCCKRRVIMEEDRHTQSNKAAILSGTSTSTENSADHSVTKSISHIRPHHHHHHHTHLLSSVTQSTSASSVTVSPDNSTGLLSFSCRPHHIHRHPSNLSFHPYYHHHHHHHHLTKSAVHKTTGHSHHHHLVHRLAHNLPPHHHHHHHHSHPHSHQQQPYNQPTESYINTKLNLVSNPIETLSAPLSFAPSNSLITSTSKSAYSTPSLPSSPLYSTPSSPLSIHSSSSSILSPSLSLTSPPTSPSSTPTSPTRLAGYVNSPLSSQHTLTDTSHSADWDTTTSSPSLSPAITNITVINSTCVSGSCHQCKSLKSGLALRQCNHRIGDNRNRKGGGAIKECKKRYCLSCLSRWYPDDYTQILVQESNGKKQEICNWTCPSCRNCCSCAACRRRQMNNKTVAVQ